MVKQTDRSGQNTLFGYDALGEMNHERWIGI
jgi:YD repeat-containing protein